MPCAICLVDVPTSGRNGLQICRQCGHRLHRSCWSRLRIANISRQSFGCPNCKNQTGILLSIQIVRIQLFLDRCLRCRRLSGVVRDQGDILPSRKRRRVRRDRRPRLPNRRRKESSSCPSRHYNGTREPAQRNSANGRLPQGQRGTRPVLRGAVFLRM